MVDHEEIIGRWEIVETEVWTKQVLDLTGEAHLTFEHRGLGAIKFIAIMGGIDYRLTTRDGRPGVEFSWEGIDEGDVRCGRGWATIDGSVMTGRLFIHQSDDSSFVARRVKA